MTTPFRAAVESATAETPYRVVDDPHGFRVELDLADAQWWGVMNRSGLSTSFAWIVEESPGGFAITDEARRLEWVAGVPCIAAVGNVQRGRIISRRRETIWGLSEAGRVERVVDYRFDSAEGRNLVEAVGAALGLEQGRGRTEEIGRKVALWVGLGVPVALAVVAIVVLLVIWMAQ